MDQNFATGSYYYNHYMKSGFGFYRFNPPLVCVNLSQIKECIFNDTMREVPNGEDKSFCLV